jgi:Svf1-like C-terminal lipocalin-like domain
MKYCYKNYLIVLLIILIASTAAIAATSVINRLPSSEKLAAKILGLDDLKLHKLEHGKYTEVWFFQLHADDGGIMMVNLSVTNAGISKWASSVDVWYQRNGQVLLAHEEYDADELSFDKDKLKLAIGPTKFSGYPPKFVLNLGEKQARGTLTIDLSTQGAPAPKSVSYFDSERTQFLSYTVLALGARASGSAVIEGVKVNLDGNIYVNHQNGTVIPPDYCVNWYSFVGTEQDFSFYLASKKLLGKYNPRDWNLLVLVKDNEIIGYTDRVNIRPKASANHAKSGYQYNTAYELSAEGKDWKLTGDLTLKTTYSWVDILAHLSAVVRFVIKTFYTNPWSMRAAYDYNLTLTRGEHTENRQGTAYTDHSFFDK